MCSCAPGVLFVDLFCFVRVIVFDLVKLCKFQLVWHIAQKVFDLGSWNFTVMLISMWTCAPWVLLVNLFCFVRIIALDLVKVFNCAVLAQKVFNLESWNLTGILVSMWSCAPGVSIVDLSNFSRVIWIDLVKTVSIMLGYVFLENLRVRINQLYRNNDQSHCEAVHLGFCMWIFFRFVRVIALDLVNICNFQLVHA
jgi:hypothetical protein